MFRRSRPTLPSLAAFVSLAGGILGHSNINCVDYDPQTDACHGYPRYFAATKRGYEGTDRGLPDPRQENNDVNLIQPAGVNSCPSGAAADRYTSQYPMAQVAPGQRLTLSHPPRGHAKQQSSPVEIRCQPQSYSSVDQVPTATVLRDSDLSAWTSLGKYPYNDCIGSDVSWAVCSGAVQVPSDWRPGQVYQCMWLWTLNGALNYADCFDVTVQGAASPASSAGTAVPRSGIASGPSQALSGGSGGLAVATPFRIRQITARRSQ